MLLFVGFCFFTGFLQNSHEKYESEAGFLFPFYPSEEKMICEVFSRSSFVEGVAQEN